MTLPALGLDVSKAKLDAALWRNGKPIHKVFTNDQKGFAKLLTWLKQKPLEQVHGCLEATSTYGDAVALFLYQQGHQVSVVNPARIKGFARSLLIRNKTDKLDAVIIARFCEAQKPELWTPPSSEMLELQGLVRRLESLEQLRQMESNRLESVTRSPQVQQSVSRMVAALDAEIEHLRTLIRELIDRHPDLKRQQQLLCSIPGIGETTANLLLSEVQLTTYRTARQVAAHAGLTPQTQESGSSVHRRSKLSKSGNKRLRKGLYFPAIVAKQYNPVIKRFCQQLQERGIQPLAIICAAMRKLLHIAFGVLKSGKPLMPNWRLPPNFQDGIYGTKPQSLVLPLSTMVFLLIAHRFLPTAFCRLPTIFRLDLVIHSRRRGWLCGH